VFRRWIRAQFSAVDRIARLMDFSLTDDQREIQRTARELLSERARPERVREHAEARRPDQELWRELSELGWPGIAISERYSGQGLGRVELSILCEELGRCVAPVPFLSTVLTATLIEQAGSEAQCERLLPPLASGEQGAAVGVLRDGRAELVIGGGEAHVLVLLEDAGGAGAGQTREAGTPPEVARARVLRAEEAEVELVASIDPTRSAANVTPGSADSGEPLEGDLQAGLDRALVAISSELVGICDRALQMTLAYVKERKQFGVPVGAFQAVSHRCAQMLLDTERARSLTAQAAWAADSDPELLAHAAPMAKAAASDAGVHVTGSAIQAHGGIGFTWEADVHWLYKRAHIDAALLGGPKQQRARLASLVATGLPATVT
jgi:alkylation response protein AidB-like acyl-CoA dehydrogenase